MGNKLLPNSTEMSHHTEPTPDFVGGEGSFASTTFLIYLWPCVNSGNSNNFNSQEKKEKKKSININLFQYSF